MVSLLVVTPFIIKFVLAYANSTMNFLCARYGRLELGGVLVQQSFATCLIRVEIIYFLKTKFDNCVISHGPLWLLYGYSIN